MNTSFASQLVGFILTNGVFESDPTAPHFDAFVIKSEDVSMKIWQPRAGWFHLAVVIGDWDSGIHYHYSETFEVTAGRTYVTRHESLKLATPDGYGDYELTNLESDFYQKAG